MSSKTEPGETRTSLDQREKSSCCSLDSQAPAKVKILQLSTSREGGNPLSSEARTSPEIEALELKLAAGEDQANLISLNVWTGRQVKILKLSIVAEYCQ